MIGAAIEVARIATGEEEDERELDADGKDPAAKALGKKGGEARAKNLSAEERSEIAARIRWKGED